MNRLGATNGNVPACKFGMGHRSDHERCNIIMANPGDVERGLVTVDYGICVTDGRPGPSFEQVVEEDDGLHGDYRELH